MLIPREKLPILSQHNTYVADINNLKMMSFYFNKVLCSRLFVKTVTIEGTSKSVSILELAGEQRFIHEAERLGYLPNKKSTKYYYDFPNSVFLFAGFEHLTHSSDKCVVKLNVFELPYDGGTLCFREQLLLDQVNIFVSYDIYKSFADIGLG